MTRLALDSSSGLFHGVSYVASPNEDARPDPEDVSLLIVHGISLPPGEFGGPWIEDLFCNRLDENAHPYFHQIAGLKVSAHLVIRRDGGLTQYVPIHRRAWHAGESSFAGRDRCNDFSVGIEMEGADDVAYTPVQYARLADVSRALMRRYSSITRDRIVGHSDVAPGRKTDPGPAFDWMRFAALLEAGNGK
jgi:AmpD protein